MTEEKIYSLIGQIIDPEVGVDIVNLGLVYGVNILDINNVKVTMTMTSRGCPLHKFITDEVNSKIKREYPDAEIEVDLVWDPVWTADMMSDQARMTLGW